MIRTKDEEINKILDKAEEYRKQFQENVYHKNPIKFDINTDFGDIFEAFFHEEKKLDYKDKNNVFINYKLNKEDLKNGCTKIIKYKSKDKYNKIIARKIEVKFPPCISEGQKIIISGCGNYKKENNSYSNLIITILGKGRRK